MVCIANKLRIYTDIPNPFAVVFYCCSKTAWKLQNAILKSFGGSGGFSKASWGVKTEFQEALEKLFEAPLQL
jgi:hypothetical protein